MINLEVFLNLKKILFWQPKKDWLRWLEQSSLGKKALIFFNYIIWFFFFYISYLLIKKNANIFWQILIATIVGEGLERFLKNKIYWRRPLFNREDKTPSGLVDSWYKTGSFPSGHTIKAVYFLLFILQYQVFSIPLFLSIVSPLLIFRVIVGFHYPIDIIGGVIAGWLMWFLSKGIVFPIFLTEIIRTIFNFVFFIK